MAAIKRIAFVGNSLPRRCGIATFTTDIQQAVAAAGLDTSIVAMTNHGHSYDYPAIVGCEICDDQLEDYVSAAHFLNAGGFDAVSLQHEFGIFGGDAGSHILATVSRLKMPVVTTLHTVLAAPTSAQRRVMDRLTHFSSKLVVMAERGRELLASTYQVPVEKIALIPHGIPDMPFAEPDAAKARLGYANRSVILTFGLLSPNKGIEVVIDAMSDILRRCPDAVYVVLGATHPNLVRHEGEAYRVSLQARARALGLGDSVVFLDQFVDRPLLLDFISMCDVYVTPYLGAAQMTSGTLAYSFGMGKAVVSTPYCHAAELLADGRGILVPFADSAAMAAAIAGLLVDGGRRLAMRERAYHCGRAMTWQQTAAHYIDLFEECQTAKRAPPAANPGQVVRLHTKLPVPDLRTDYFLTMCDHTGMLQHAIHSIPDRTHGYCIDDNARALLLACALNATGEAPLPDHLVAIFASFIQHAWNPDTRRFRNFMSYDRRWLEDSGSEDSHGRTLWALGECARNDANPSRRIWAAVLFADALPSVRSFTSPRAWAFTLLGLDAYCAANRDPFANKLRRELGNRLMTILAAVETPSWVWFEERLTYDNARLPQALIATGTALSDQGFVAAGLRSLAWIAAVQKSPAGQFRPVGTAGFGTHRSSPAVFDQQPLEATAMIAACHAAARANGASQWLAEARLAFSWFLGENDLSLPLVDIDTGSCRDGLHADRRNEN
ncbi:MAG: glycosyltransferase family 4 protein, partial [Acetobacteraceae bacterium]|nr:glycosyltransferase family 4 protein [Acetobacteraceae bacterium]